MAEQQKSVATARPARLDRGQDLRFLLATSEQPALSGVRIDRANRDARVGDSRTSGDGMRTLDCPAHDARLDLRDCVE